MSLPLFDETVTAEQAEQALRNGSIIIQHDGADGHYGFDKKLDMFYFEYYGECKKRRVIHRGAVLNANVPVRTEICVEWEHEPSVKHFDTFLQMCLWAAFVGMEWT
jgi:hypothetical protein